MADLTQQLQIQRQINALLSKRSDLLEKANQSLSKQALLSKQVFEAMQGKNLDGLKERIDGINRSFAKVTNNAEKAAGGFDKMKDGIEKSHDKLKKFNKDAAKMAGLVGALKGLKAGFTLVGNVVKGAARLIGSFVKSVFNIGKAILSIPFKIFSGLVEMSQQLGSPVFRQALEEVRKTFGDIASGSGLALRNSVKGMRTEFNSLTGATRRSGASFGRIFGYGREGMAKALKENAELAGHLGGSFAQLRSELKGNYAELTIYRKGLGFTTEQQALLIKLTAKSGGDIFKRQKDLAQMAAGVGKAFGYSSKEVGRGLGEMLQDVKTFGGFTDKQLVQIRVQALRLGASMQALTGVAAGFDDYEKAQQNVSFLNRAFGMTVDTMKIFREQDPVKRIQMLQKSFKAAGRDIETMSRQELQYFSQSVGVSEQDAKILFAKKNLQMDYNKVKRVTNKESKKELKTATVLKNLSKQIERIFGQGSEKYKGFFDALGKGFNKGIRRTTEMRKVMRNLNRSLRATDFAGQRLGRNFVKHFPGVKELLGALADFFDPNKLVPALNEANGAFKTFFIQLRGGKSAPAALDVLMKSLLKTMKKYFGGKGEALELIKTATDTLVTLFVNIKLDLYRRAAKSAAEGLRGMTEILSAYNKDPNGTLAKMGEAGGKMFGSRFGESTNRLINRIKFDLWPAIKAAAPVLLEAASNLMGMFRDFLYSHKGKIVSAISDTLKFVFKMKLAILGEIASQATSDPIMAAMLGTMLFGPAIVQGLASFIGAKVTAAVAASMATGVLGKALGTAAPMIGPQLPMGAKMAHGMKNFASGTLNVAKGFLSKFAPLAIGGSILYGAYKGITADGPLSQRLEAAARGTGAGLISAFTFGIVDGTSAIDSIFGTYIADPVERHMNHLEKRGSAAEKSLVRSAKVVSRAAKGYLEYASASKAAGRAADSMGKYYSHDDASSHSQFKIMEKNLGKASARRAASFGEDKIRMLKRSQDTLVSNTGYRAGTGRASGRYTKRKGEELRNNAARTMMTNPAFEAAIDQILEETVMTGRNEGDFQGPDFMKRQTALAYKKVMGPAGAASTKAAFTPEKLLGPNFRSKHKHFGNNQTQIKKGFTDLLSDIDKRMAKAAGEAAKESQASLNSSDIYGQLFGKGGMQGQANLESYGRYLQNNLDTLIESGSGDQGMIESYRKKIKAHNRLSNLKLTQEANKIRKTESISVEAEVQELIKGHNKSLGPITEEVKREYQTQAQKRVNAALKTGDLSGIQNVVLREQIGKIMNQQGLGKRIVGAQEKQLDELEATAVTVDRIKNLSALPEELEKLRKKLANVDLPSIRKTIQTLVTTAVGISTIMTEELKGKLDKKVDNQIHGSVMSQLQNTQRLSDAVFSVIGKRSVSENTMTTRVDRFKSGVSKLKVGLKELGKTGLTTAEQKNLSLLALHMPAISTGILNSLPDGIEDKLTKAKLAIETAQDMAEGITKIAGGTVEGTVNLVDAINEGGELHVSMLGLPSLNANFIVKVDTSELATRIANATFTTSGNTFDQFRTTWMPNGSQLYKKDSSMTHGTPLLLKR